MGHRDEAERLGLGVRVRARGRGRVRARVRARARARVRVRGRVHLAELLRADEDGVAQVAHAQVARGLDVPVRGLARGSAVSGRPLEGWLVASKGAGAAAHEKEKRPGPRLWQGWPRGGAAAEGRPPCQRA